MPRRRHHPKGVRAGDRRPRGDNAIDSKAQAIFRTVGLPVAHAPDLGAGWVHFQKHAATVRELVTLWLWLGVADLEIGQREDSSWHFSGIPSGRTWVYPKNYPQTTRRSTDDVKRAGTKKPLAPRENSGFWNFL